MTAPFVVDSSAALTWLFPDEATPRTDELLARLDKETVIVHALWFFELANVIYLAERKNRIAQAQSAVFIDEISRLDIEVDHLSAARSFTHLLPLCRSETLTSYDAVYLDLAIRRQVPLATLDEPLRKAAKKLGVDLLGK